MNLEDTLIRIFCLVDDFCEEFEPEWQHVLLECVTPKGDKRRKCSPRLAKSEIMTLVIHFHYSHFRTFKHYYNLFVLEHVYKVGKWA